MAPLSRIDRRRFIKTSAAVGGALTFMPILNWSKPVNQANSLQWYQRPLRILQTVMREPDAANYNAEAVVNYMEKTGCNTLVVNGGGIVDFFQNPLPAANVNSFMGKNDVLREITNACRKAGMRVIARVDFRGVEEHIYKQFPDWFSKDEDNKPRQLAYTRPMLYSSCYNSYHRNEHAREFINYIMSHYALDGVWHNSIGVQGICYCDRCRQSYKTSTGQELPLINAAEEKLDQYMAWKALIADRHMADMKKTVKAFGEDKVYTAEVFSMFDTGARVNDGIDLYNARDHFDFLVSVAFLTENSERIHYADLKYANTIVKFLKSMTPDKEAIILYGGNGTSHRYVMDPPLDLKVWLWEALAAGGRFWNCSFTGTHPASTHDRRTAFHQTDAYLFVKQHENLLTQHVSVANVGIYYSRPTRQSFRNKSVEGDSFAPFIRGMETVLTEGHIPHDFIADDQVTSDRLKKYSVVILDNVRCLSDQEIALLSDYVRAGGNILATYETSLFTAEGRRREDFGLASLFGCRFTGEKVNTRKDCYQFILDPAHPIVKPDSGETELLINAGYTLLCKPASTAKAICTYVPVVNNQPPEKAWTLQWARGFPTVVEHTYGKGKVIYFSNQPDLITDEMGHPDVRNLLERSIRYLAGDSLAVETNAPASVHIGLTRSALNPNEFIFSLVNTTSGPARPLRNLLPVHDLTIKLRLPGKLARSKVLRSTSEVSTKTVNNFIEVDLPRIDDFFALHLTIA